MKSFLYPVFISVLFNLVHSRHAAFKEKFAKDSCQIISAWSFTLQHRNTQYDNLESTI